jgi:hypothetical protein
MPKRERWETTRGDGYVLFAVLILGPSRAMTRNTVLGSVTLPPALVKTTLHGRVELHLRRFWLEIAWYIRTGVTPFSTVTTGLAKIVANEAANFTLIMFLDLQNSRNTDLMFGTV